MNWILASMLMFVCSVLLYLTVRKSSLMGVPSALNNLAMFAVPIFFYVPFGLITHENFTLTFYQFLIIVISAYFFSYLGNVYSLKSIDYAPNPGYSLIISKSYVVFTTIVSIFLFQSVLTLRSSIAILLIVGASALIMINKKPKSGNTVRKSWLPLAIGAFFCWGLLSITSKYLLLLGVGVLERLNYTMLIVTFLIMLDLKRSKISWNTMSGKQVILFIFTGLFSAGFNYFMQEGINSAPNIGFVNAINASSIAAVSVFSALLFGDELTKRKLLGVVGVTAGLILLVI